MEMKNIMVLFILTLLPVLGVGGFTIMVIESIRFNKWRKNMLEESKQHHKKMENMCVIDIRNLENDKDSE